MKNIKGKCPSCGKIIKAPPEYKDNEIKCSKCQKTFKLQTVSVNYYHKVFMSVLILILLSLSFIVGRLTITKPDPIQSETIYKWTPEEYKILSQIYAGLAACEQMPDVIDRLDYTKQKGYFKDIQTFTLCFSLNLPCYAGKNDLISDIQDKLHENRIILAQLYDLADLMIKKIENNNPPPLGPIINRIWSITIYLRTTIPIEKHYCELLLNQQDFYKTYDKFIENISFSESYYKDKKNTESSLKQLGETAKDIDKTYKETKAAKVKIK